MGIRKQKTFLILPSLESPADQYLRAGPTMSRLLNASLYVFLRLATAEQRKIAMEIVTVEDNALKNPNAPLGKRK